MALPRSNSRAMTNARNEVIQQLKDDHKRVKKAYRDFQKLDREADPEACEALVRQVLQELTLHATLEEELLYPRLHDAIDEPDLVDEAEVEHESMHSLIDQLQGMGPDDEKFAARFTVLCEYTMHHVKEEEGEMFPQLEKARLDWPAIAAEMNERRAALSPAEAEGDDAAALAEDGEDAMATAGSGNGSTMRAGDRKTGAKAAPAKRAGAAAKRAPGSRGAMTMAEPGDAIDSRRI